MELTPGFNERLGASCTEQPYPTFRTVH